MYRIMLSAIEFAGLEELAQKSPAQVVGFLQGRATFLEGLPVQAYQTPTTPTPPGPGFVGTANTQSSIAPSVGSSSNGATLTFVPADQIDSKE